MGKLRGAGRLRFAPAESLPDGGRQLGERTLPHESVRFAHNSERQFAKLLDFYGVAWEYEPVEFVLEWTRAGEPASAFRPDFLLPDHSLFIEITTLNQKLVTKKNRKVRRLRELHPEVKVKVLYQRDYLNLLVKYGLEEPADGCDDSGNSGSEEGGRPALRVHRGGAETASVLAGEEGTECAEGWGERRRLAP